MTSFFTPETIRVGVSVGPDRNDRTSVCPVARIFTEVPPTSMTSTLLPEAPLESTPLINEFSAASARRARFTVGWYVSRLFSLATSTIVLVFLLAETTKLYGRLARSNAMLLREQNNRLMTLDALASSISHEVRQPLTGIVASGSALLRFLGGTPPKLDKARSGAEGIIAAAHRASQMLDDIRNLFGSAKHAQTPVDMNYLTLNALRALESELKSHNVTTRIQLASQLPPIKGHSGQLQEVIVNLIQNAVDAMDLVDNDRRLLQVRTKYNGGDAISVEIEDTGPGIDPKKSDNIFDAFFTTKPDGMGLGLAICRMIIERHEGQLVASSAKPHGANFRITLPQMKLKTVQATETRGHSKERSPTADESVASPAN